MKFSRQKPKKCIVCRGFLPQKRRVYTKIHSYCKNRYKKQWAKENWKNSDSKIINIKIKDCLVCGLPLLVDNKKLVHKHCKNTGWWVASKRSPTKLTVRQYYRLKDKQRAFRLRLEIFKKYGNKCACCGEGNYEFLAIDHMRGGGKKHRASFSYRKKYYQWLVEKKRKDFRILCHNCNVAHGLYGYCPHKVGSKVKL